MSKLDFEYWLIEATNDMPGKLAQKEFVECIYEMTTEEFSEMNKALKDYYHYGVAVTIRKSICRQYAEEITKYAEGLHQGYLEMIEDDVRRLA